MWLYWSGGWVCDRIRRGLSKFVPLPLPVSSLNYSVKCVRAYVYESKVFVSMVLILIFGEVLGLYG